MEEFLLEHTKNKKSFSLRQLKKDYPKERKQIEKYCFVGIIEPVNMEQPDTVRAHYYT